MQELATAVRMLPDVDLVRLDELAISYPALLTIGLALILVVSF